MSKPPELSRLDATQRYNARLIVLGQTSSKLGDVVCNAKTVLTWLMGVVGAPPALTAWLVPIRESGSMLPQAFISGFVKRVPHRKWVYSVGSVGQALCLVAMGMSALFLEGSAAGWAVVVALALSSLARCLCSISSKDLLGKSLPKGTRGRIGGAAAAISGVLGLGAALVVMLGVEKSASPWTYGWLILGGSALYLITASSIAGVKEEPSEEAAEDLLGDFKERAGLVMNDPVLRRFVFARGMLLGSALASPYLVVLSQQQGFELRSLAAFVLAGGLASALSSLLWGKLSDHSSRLAMAIGGAIAGGVGLLGVTVGLAETSAAHREWIWPALFFLLNLGYAGVRIGRKTYVVDVTKGAQRTDYVSTSNTLIALMILVLGGIGSALQAFHAVAALALFSGLCLAGALYSVRLRPVDRE